MRFLTKQREEKDFLDRYKTLKLESNLDELTIDESNFIKSNSNKK